MIKLGGNTLDDCEHRIIFKVPITENGVTHPTLNLKRRTVVMVLLTPERGDKLEAIEIMRCCSTTRGLRSLMMQAVLDSKEDQLQCDS